MAGGVGGVSVELDLKEGKEKAKRCGEREEELTLVTCSTIADFHPGEPAPITQLSISASRRAHTLLLNSENTKAGSSKGGVDAGYGRLVLALR